MRNFPLLFIAIVVVLSIALGGYPHKRGADLAIIGGEVASGRIAPAFGNPVFFEDYHKEKCFDDGSSCRYLRGQNMGCGAALVADAWVLTAAHCIASFERRYPKVEIGIHFAADGVITDGGLFLDSGKLYKVTQIIVHPKYSALNGHVYDFALMRLEHPPPITPFKLDFSPKKREGRAYVVGFGETVACMVLQEGCASHYPSTLQQVELGIISDSECRKNFARLASKGFANAALALIDEVMFCAGQQGGLKDTCQGDSGGPIFQDPYHEWRERFWWLPRASVLGVVSWGYGCGDANAYGVYADIAAAQVWIEQTILQEGGF